MTEKITIYPKHIIYINDIKMNLGNDIKVNYDIDETYYNGSFNLPDTSNIEVVYNSLLTPEENRKISERIKKTINNIKYLDSIKIYYKEFNSEIERKQATYLDMDLMVDGYIADADVNENRGDSLDRNIIFKSTMGLVYENSMQYDLILGDCANTIINGLGQELMIPNNVNYNDYLEVVTIKDSNNQDITQKYVYDFTSYENEQGQKSFIKKIIFDTFTHSQYFIVKGNSTTNFGESIDTIKKNHTIKIFQHPDGTLNVTTPNYFYNDTAKVLQFDVKSNIQDINFGGMNNLYNAVVVHGTGCNGFAFDPISYELALPQELKTTDNAFYIDYLTQKIKNENPNSPQYVLDVIELKAEQAKRNTFKPNIKYLRIKHLFRRNIFDPFTAYNTAVNELYDISKNSTITFSTVYSSDIRPGKFFQIKNSKYLKNLSMENAKDEDEAQKIADGQIWIIKRVEMTISKNNITCAVTGYRNAIADFPERWITPSSGLSILDLNYLSSVDKNKNIINLH